MIFFKYVLKNYFVPEPQCGEPIWHQNELEQTKKLAKHVAAAQYKAVHQDKDELD